MPDTDRPRLVPALERATFRAETPIRKVVRSHRLNPLPHAGTISVFLLAVVIVTGVYITLFFGFGFEASHRSVEKMTDHPIQTVVRTIHRYASAGLVLTTLVHAWRIFVAGRFRGPRRWRWTTGVAALALVWLAGVTGYWLVWDVRAQALNEATESVFGGLGAVRTFFVRDVYGPGVDTGWGVMFLIWFVHLLLTAVIAWFVWRHVRRSRLRVLPPRHWMAIMFAALLLASLLVPADLLAPADPGRAIGDVPLDPFVLFLLPPLLGGWGWPALLLMLAVVAVALAAPHVRRAPTPVVAIDEDACTGCELCVVDCPYLALEMVERSDADADSGTQARRPIAVVDADACVGCGICVGSCSFGAMELPGFDSPTAIEPAGKHVVIACARHVASAGAAGVDALRADGDVAVVEVACSGMVHANAIGSLMQAGATEVQVVGCAPGDCAYGLGNTVLAERLAGTRSPHVPRRWEGVAEADWVAPGELLDAIASPNAHPSADDAGPVNARRLVGAIAVVVVSILAVAFATRAPYHGDDEGASVRVIVDHVPGQQLEGQAAPTGRRGDDVEVVVRAGGSEIGRAGVATTGDSALDVVDVDLTSDVDGTSIEVALVESTGEAVLYDGVADLGDDQRLLVYAVDVPPPPGIAAGRDVFDDRGLGGCGVCHSTSPGEDGVGPSLAGVATRAETRVPGLTAEEYLHQSITDPSAYVVEGYREGQMLPIYEERLSPEQIDALVQYLMSLNDAGDDADATGAGG